MTFAIIEFKKLECPTFKEKLMYKFSSNVTYEKVFVNNEFFYYFKVNIIKKYSKKIISDIENLKEFLYEEGINNILYKGDGDYKKLFDGFNFVSSKNNFVDNIPVALEKILKVGALKEKNYKVLIYDPYFKFAPKMASEILGLFTHVKLITRDLERAESLNNELLEECGKGIMFEENFDNTFYDFIILLGDEKEFTKYYNNYSKSIFFSFRKLDIKDLKEINSYNIDFEEDLETLKRFRINYGLYVALTKFGFIKEYKINITSFVSNNKFLSISNVISSIIK